MNQGDKVHYTANIPCYSTTFSVERDVDMTPLMVWITSDHVGYWAVLIDHVHKEKDCIKLKFLEFMRSL